MVRHTFDLLVFDWDGTLKPLFSPEFESTSFVGHPFQTKDSFSVQHSHSQAPYLFPGALAMLHDLKRHHYGLAVATGKSRRGLNQVLQHPMLLKVFDTSRTADETHAKPHPMMLEEIMAELAIPPERTLMIGDSTVDLEMAHHAGCASIGVRYDSASSPNGFLEWKPKAVLHSVTELHQWLLQYA
jgi:phosphoglycolate phosphatase